MTVYYIFLILSLFSYWAINPYLGEKRTLFWAVSVGIIIFLIMALRNPSVGVDISRYINEYNFGFNSAYKNNEIGFYYTRVILKACGFSGQQYLALVSGFIVFSVGRFYYKYSKNPFVSFWLFFCIGLFSMSMSGLRQMIAISILLFAIDDVINRNLFKFSLKLILAITFHKSAFSFFPIYFLYSVKITKKSALFFICVSIALLFVSDIVLRFIITVSQITYFDIYKIGVHSISRLVVIEYFGITILCVVFLEKKSYFLDRNIYSLLIWMSLLNTMIAALSLDMVIFSRIGMYFIIANDVLIPNVISGIENKYVKTVGWLACLSLSAAQFLISTPNGTLQIDNYKFFFL